MITVMTWRGPLTPSGVKCNEVSAAHETPDGVRLLDALVAINRELLPESMGFDVSNVQSP